MIAYSGTITRIIFYSEETKFIVARFDADEEDKPFAITGNMSYVNTDDRYRITGDFVIHPRYGKQFQIQSYEILLADDHDEIIRYLSSPLFKGIGKKQAELIVDTLGEDCLNQIKKDPTCLHIVRGMSEKKVKTIVDVLTNQDYDQEVLSFFMGHGISTRHLSLIQGFYKEKTLDVLKSNPYQLIDDIDGIGFKSADTLAMKMKFDPKSPYRIKAAIADALMQACFRTGSTYSDISTLHRIFHRFLPEVDNETFEDSLYALIEDKKIIQKIEKYYPKDLYDSEKSIANLFKKFSRLPKGQVEESLIDERIEEVEDELGINYDETQRNAIHTFINEPAMILTGGPGTGKTTVVQGILKVFKQMHPELHIDLVAPTGRAAKRLSELTGIEASTIHRLLKWDLHANTFMMNKNNPLDTDLLVIDEFSMVDSLLFARVLEAGTHIKKILLIGDDQQLPSVAPGNVLRDLLASKKVEVVALNTIHRQEEGSGIIRLAHAIRNDEYDVSLFDQYEDISFKTCLNYEVVKETLALVSSLLDDGYEMNDIQVLSPMYNGVAGIDALNEALQNLLNPSSYMKEELKVGRRLFREGDKILQLKNRPDENVFNGDIGTLVEIIFKDGEEYLSDTLVVDFDGIMIEYTANDFIQITHAYCMSVHKSQGNEFPVVIMSILPDYSIMMRKNLIYTGLTRAKRELYLLGNPQVFKKALSLDVDNHRHTTLVEEMASSSIKISDFEDTPF